MTGLIGVHVDEIRKWDAAGAPPMAEKLLLLWDKKHVGIEGWEGFMFWRGVLHRGRRRWTPKMVEELIRSLRS